jgi:cytochrome c peroxidase
MKIKLVKLVVIAVLIVGTLSLLLLRGETAGSSEDKFTNTGLGNVESLQANYKAWEEEFIKNGGDRNEVMQIGWFRGLSNESTDAHGTVKLNLIDGKVAVEAGGLSEGQWDFWLIDNRTGSIAPEPGDNMVRVGSLEQGKEVAKLEVDLGSQAFADFEVDLVVVTRAGKDPVESRVLVGTTTLFHRLYRSGQRGQFGVLSEHPVQEPEKIGLLDRLMRKLNLTASAQIGPIINPSTPLQQLITAGRKSFFNDTFSGNGRTCGTCHREDNNLTIDPEFIARLPINDPLFVAETQPALKFNFENPILMRKFGLILENVDGFGDLPNRFVMRGVPHTLGLLPNTLTPARLDETSRPPNQRTGWSGDGAPGTGTLREFIVGAVTQHYPKSLNRTPGTDFVLPTVAQMDALEAFQKSTGRRADLNLNTLRLKSEVAEKGRQIFLNPGNTPPFFLGNNKGAGKCFLCHANAGAGDTIEQLIFGEATATGNSNFDTGVEDLRSQPADLTGQRNPPDGGFGQTLIMRNGVSIGFGNGAATSILNQRTFNTPVLVEAADTGPFFHNNSVETIEGAVAFYTGDAFNNSPAGQLASGIELDATEIVSLAAFLRVINSLENIRSSVDLVNRAKTATNLAQAQELIKLSISELEDAIQVLDGGGLHPVTQSRLRTALTIQVGSLLLSSQTARNVLLNQSLSQQAAARTDMSN